MVNEEKCSPYYKIRGYNSIDSKCTYKNLNINLKKEVKKSNLLVEMRTVRSMCDLSLTGSNEAQRN